MKSFLAFAICLITFQLGIAQTYNTVLQHERDSINQVFADEETSILLAGDIKDFEGLNYFPIDVKWKVKARFEVIENVAVFEMPTSTDRKPEYKPYGKLKFTAEGVDCELTIYQNVALLENEDYKDYLFLPFTDLTCGEESYGGGRYIDLRIGDLEGPIIDFNTSYNPYCAYNHKYSCPIPPMENHLNIKVMAGVKKWH